MIIFQSTWPQLDISSFPVIFSYSIDSTLLGSALFYSHRLFLFAYYTFLKGQYGTSEAFQVFVISWADEIMQIT